MGRGLCRRGSGPSTGPAHTISGSMNIYEGKFSQAQWYQVEMNARPFDYKKSLKVRNHSPDGFAWGYNGSGPAQLALAILLEETSRGEAESFYQYFKQSVIAGLDKDSAWRLTSEDVRKWLDARRTLTE